MSLTPIDRRKPELAGPKLPVLSMEELSTILSTGTRPDDVRGSAQNRLSLEVQDALFDLQRVLSTAPKQYGSSIAVGVTLSPTTNPIAAETFVGGLIQEIESLYFVDGILKEDMAERLREAVRVIHNHFREVASSLLADGYQKFSIVAARNSFGDSWHVHDFLTYVLYCGREVGTEVVTSPPDDSQLIIRERKDAWMRRSHDVLSMCKQGTQTVVSDTDMGLLLPPDIAHRACHSKSSHGKDQANLALVLLAFRE